MLYWSIIFFLVSIAAAVLGFGGIADAASGIAQVLFFLFLILFIISVVATLAGAKKMSDIFR